MLAQLVEQRTFNPFVVGSTPAHPTKIKSTKCLISKASYTEAFVISGLEMSFKCAFEIFCNGTFQHQRIARNNNQPLAGLSSFTQEHADILSVLTIKTPALDTSLILLW